LVFFYYTNLSAQPIPRLVTPNWHWRKYLQMTKGQSAPVSVVLAIGSCGLGELRAHWFDIGLVYLTYIFSWHARIPR
jgi:hypothetical protein